MLLISICCLVTNFCHYLLYNIVKNLQLLFLVVSALCYCFLGFIGTSLFLFPPPPPEATIDKIIHLQQFVITSGLAINYSSFGLLLHSIYIFFLFFHFTIQTLENTSSLFVHSQAQYSEDDSLYPCPSFRYHSVTALPLLFGFFLWPAFLRFS